MKQVLLTTLLAIAGALFGPSVVHAQTCGLLADPNSPTCKGGTAAPPVGTAATTARAASGAATAPGQTPGRGQYVCAFFDQASGRCLSIRPNTQAYDSAVDTGIAAAMMGMQIQADAIHRAGQMGVLGQFGRTDGTGSPMPAVPATAPGAPALPAASATDPSLVPGMRPDSPATVCVRARVEEQSRQLGRALGQQELEKILSSCAPQ